MPKIPAPARENAMGTPKRSAITMTKKGRKTMDFLSSVLKINW
jgi:hypothetical protein